MFVLLVSLYVLAILPKSTNPLLRLTLTLRLTPFLTDVLLFILGTRGKSFSGSNFLEYTFTNSEPIAQTILVIGFKTTKSDVALAQLEGENFRHATLVLVDGYITLYYSMKSKLVTENGFESDDEVKALRITKRRLNNDKHNVARLFFSHDSVFLTVPNYNLMVSDNVTERTVGDTETWDKFGKATKLFIGRVRDIKAGLSRSVPTSFEGCMSGAKIVVHPHATREKRFRRSLELDMFKMMDEQKNADNNVVRNPAGDLPSVECGFNLKVPG